MTSSEASRASASSASPSRSASTCPRIAVSGVRSSCDTVIRKCRSSSFASASLRVISPKRSARWAISSPERTSGTSTSYRPAATSSAARERARTGLRHSARQVEEQQARDDEPAEAGEADPPDEDEPAIAQLRLRLCDDERPERLPEHLDGLRDGEIRAILAGRHELEGLRALRRGGEPGLLGRQPAKTGDVTGEEPDADVVEAGAGGLLEPRHDETRRRRPLVDALERLLGEELAELAGLPPEVGLWSGSRCSPGRGGS